MDARFEGVKAVFFDVDDTLYDFAQSMGYAFEHLRAAYPDTIGRHEVDLLATAYWDFYRGYDEAAKVALINADPDLFRRTMWAGTLAKLGMDGDPDGFVRGLATEFQRMRPAQWRRAMYEGAAELLDDLKPRLVLGAITNGPPAVQRPKLVALDYPRWFPEERVFVSGEFGVRKPDPRIFAAAARSAGVAPAECLMVGDAREFDMPAKALGFRTILFHGPRDRPDCGADAWHPDAIVSTYREIRELLL